MIELHQLNALSAQCIIGAKHFIKSNAAILSGGGVGIMNSPRVMKDQLVVGICF